MMNACGGGSNTGGGSTIPTDTTPPSVVSTDPVHLTVNANIPVISISFSRPIAKVKSNNVTITPIESNGIIGTPITIADNFLVRDNTKNDKVLDVKLSNAGITLTPDLLYMVEVQGITAYDSKYKREGVCRWLFATGPNVDFNIVTVGNNICDTPRPNKKSAILSFELATSSVTELSQFGAEISVIRIGDVNGSVSVNFTTSDNGSATVGTDYTVTKGVLTFLDGETQQKIIVPIIDDSDVENNETFIITLSSPSAGVNLGTKVHEVNIIDNDLPQPGILSFELKKSNILEDSGSATIMISRTGGLDGAVSVNYKTVDGSATLAGKDYVSTTGMITFIHGDNTPKTIIIPITKDNIPELDEFFSVQFIPNSETGGAMIGINTHTVIIKNDDSVGKVGFVVSEITKHEYLPSPTKVQLSVTRKGGVGPLTVNFETLAGTAVANLDYVPKNGQLTFLGDGTQLVIISVISDAIVEPPIEYFKVKLIDSIKGLGALNTNNTVTVYIEDGGASYKIKAAVDSLNELLLLGRRAICMDKLGIVSYRCRK